jgi:membrane protease YdiL (CAAX protease family)
MVDERTQLPEAIPSGSPTLAGWRAVAITVVFFVVQVVMGIALGIGVGVHVAITGGGQDTASRMADTLGRAMLPAALAGVVLGAFVAFRMTRRTLHGPISSGALAPIGWRPAPVSQTAMAVLVGCLLSVLYMFVLARISPPTEGQPWGPLATAALSGGWPRLLWALLALVVAPPIEEFVFRGVLLQGLSQSLGVPRAAVIVTAVFVLAHASEALAYWPAWVGVILFSIAAVLFRLRTRSLVPAVAVHAAYNLGLVVAVFAGAA